MAKAYAVEALEEFRRTGMPHDSMMRLSPLKCQRRWLATVDELRAELEQQREMFREMNEQRQRILRENFQQRDEMDRLKAENARLRGALEKISEVGKTDPEDVEIDETNSGDWMDKGVAIGAYSLGEIARAALKGDDDADNQD